MDDNHFKAMALSHYVLLPALIGLLYKRGVITAREAYDAHDHALLTLEHFQAKSGDAADAFALARQMIEKAMGEIEKPQDF